MEVPMTSARDINRLILKDDDTLPLSPPPAYSPSRPIDLRAQSVRQSGQSRIAQPRPMLLNRTPTASLAAEETESESGEGLSSVSLRIDTSINVASDNNIICLTDTPANHANAIAHAVVRTLREHSSGQCGIPMIDEEGRPRPIRIQVDAGVTVRGAGNVVGGEPALREYIRQRRRRDIEEPAEENESNPAKRQRQSQ